MKKVLNVTLAVEVEVNDAVKVGDIVDALDFKVNSEEDNVEVKDSYVVDYFEV